MNSSSKTATTMLKQIMPTTSTYETINIPTNPPIPSSRPSTMGLVMAEAQESPVAICKRVSKERVKSPKRSVRERGGFERVRRRG